MTGYRISPEVRRHLEQRFVEERDLIDGLREQRGAEDPSEPGTYVCSFMMTVRRPMDLETAELRRVVVRMRADAEGYEVVSVEGLDDEEAPN